MEEKLTSSLERDRFIKYVGIIIEKVEPGYALGKLEIKDYHLNGADVIQGGAIFTLADFTFAAAANAHGRVTLGLNANISFYKASRGKVLYAEAKEVSATKRTASYVVEVFNEDRELIALLTATGYRKDEAIQVDIVK